MQPIIITGGPGAGKTTLINTLSEQGFVTFEEVSRTLIEQQSHIDNGILPWEDLPGFASLCLEVMSVQKRQASQHDLVFLDRAIPDICGYLEQANLAIDDKYIRASQGYSSPVFFCRPEASIYVQDEIRPYPFEGALEIHQALVVIYERLGYEVIHVPFMSPERRAEFVLSRVVINEEVSE